MLKKAPLDYATRQLRNSAGISQTKGQKKTGIGFGMRFCLGGPFQSKKSRLGSYFSVTSLLEYSVVQLTG